MITGYHSRKGSVVWQALRLSGSDVDHICKKEWSLALPRHSRLTQADALRLLIRSQHVRSSPITRTNRTVNVAHPPCCCFGTRPMNSSMWLADDSPNCCHNSGRHGSSIAAPAPDFGGPILILVVNGV